MEIHWWDTTSWTRNLLDIDIQNWFKFPGKPTAFAELVHTLLYNCIPRTNVLGGGGGYYGLVGDRIAGKQDGPSLIIEAPSPPPPPPPSQRC